MCGMRVITMMIVTLVTGVAAIGAWVMLGPGIPAIFSGGGDPAKNITRKRDARRDHLLDLAADLGDQRGVRNVTMAALAEAGDYAVGVSAELEAQLALTCVLSCGPRQAEPRR